MKNSPAHKDVLLIFPPPAHPMSAPLGIATLKAYLSKHGFSAKCLDLNLELFLNLDRYKHDAFDASFIRTALSVLKANPPSYFFQKNVYSDSAKLFSDFEEWFSRMLLKEMNELSEGCAPKEGSAADILSSLIKKEKNDGASYLLAGFSIMLKEQIIPALSLARIVKELFGCPVVFGGPGIDEGQNLLLGSKGAVDYILFGEAEEGLAQLISYLKKDSKTELPLINNLIWLDGTTAERNQPSFIKDLTEIPPPDFSDFKLSEYFSPDIVLPVLSSRGCPWKRCAFCTHFKNYSDQYRVKEAKAFVKELLHLKKTYNCKLFSFNDELMMPKLLDKIASELINKKAGISYFALSKPGGDFTGRILENAAGSGCKAILWGVESGTQRLLDLMDKGTNVPEIEATLLASRGAGIKNYVYMMVGFPTQTEEEFKNDMEFLERNRAQIDSVLRGPFYFHPSSRIGREPEKFGITSFKDSQYEVDRGLTKKQVFELFRTHVPFFRSFSAHSTYFNNYREHMLFYYANEERFNKQNPLKEQTISVCMIAKDEQKYIGKALASIKDHTEEIIVVDTGSKDRTKEIAAQYGAVVYDFPWERDFSKARNFSFSKASKDWLFAMDADEVMAAQDLIRLKNLLKELSNCPCGIQITTRNYIENPHISRWTPCRGEYPEYEITSGWMPSEKVRLVPNRLGLEFENPVHELLEPGLKKKGLPVVISDIPIHHFGSLLNSPRSLRKKEYYLEIGRKKVEEYPKSAKAHFELGVQYNVSGFPEKAEFYFKKAIELDPYFPDTYFNLGYVYIVMERYTDAEIILKKHLTFDNGNPHTFANLGLALQRLERFKEAEDALLRAIKINPAMIIAYINLAIVYTCTKNFEKAKKCLCAAQKIDPRYSEIYTTMGSVLMSEKDYTAAQKVLLQAVEINPKEYAAFKQLGTCFWLAGQNYAKAVSWWEKYLGANPNDPEAQKIIARIAAIKRLAFV